MSASLDTVMQLLAQLSGGQDHVELEESAKGKTQVRVIHYGPEAEQTAAEVYDRLRERYGQPLELTTDEMVELLVAADAHLSNMGGMWSTKVPDARIGAVKRATAKLQAAMGPDAVLEAQRRALLALESERLAETNPSPEAADADAMAEPPGLTIMPVADQVVEAVAQGATIDQALDAAYPETAPPPRGMGRTSNGELFELEPTPFDDEPAAPPVPVRAGRRQRS